MYFQYFSISPAEVEEWVAITESMEDFISYVSIPPTVLMKGIFSFSSLS